MNDAIETAESIIEDINKGNNYTIVITYILICIIGKVVQNIKDTDGILNEILKKQG